MLLTHAIDRSSHCTTSSTKHIKSEWGINARISALLISMLLGDDLLTAWRLSFRAKSRNPDALPTKALRDPSPPLRFAQDDRLIVSIFSTCTRPSLIPERIKVEPVVRRQTRVMLQAREVALCPRLRLLRAMLPIQHDFISERFEINVVAIPAAIEAEE